MGAGTRMASPASESLCTSALLDWRFFEAEDMVAGVEAGMPLAEFRKKLTEHHMQLPASPWFEGATMGGVVAANDFGAERMTGGGWRDAIIGMEYIDCHGEVVRVGGKVVKNVTGYDLSRMMIGSLGGLGVLTAINFKLMPARLNPHTLCGQWGDRSWVTCMAALHHAKLPIDWAQAVFVGGNWLVGIGISGNEARRTRLAEELSRCFDNRLTLFQSARIPDPFAGFATEALELGFLTPHARALGQDFLHIHGRFPTSFWLSPAKWYPDPEKEMRVIVHPFGGDGHWMVHEANARTFLTRLEQVVEGVPGYLVLERFPKSWEKASWLVRPLPAEYSIMQRLKLGMDPQGLFQAPFYQQSAGN